MTALRPTTWQKRRSDFNHQWLKNQFLSALDAADQVISGRIRAVAFLQELIDVDLPEWIERREDLNTLLGDFENEMSPQKLFENPPLSECEPLSKEILAELMHELWLVRYPIKNWLNDAREKASDVDTNYGFLMKTSPIDANGRICPEFAFIFEKFRSACRALSKAIEKFPDRILVT
jgi:hypothetical protein